MSWNYRIVRIKLEDDGEKSEYFDIREIYYDNKGNIDGCTIEPSCPNGETIKELKDKLEMMLKALEKPILNLDDI